VNTHFAVPWHPPFPIIPDFFGKTTALSAEIKKNLPICSNIQKTPKILTFFRCPMNFKHIVQAPQKQALLQNIADLPPIGNRR